MKRTLAHFMSTLLLLALCAVPPTVQAQPNPPTPRFTVGTFGPVTTLDRRVRGLLEEQLAARDLPQTGVPWMLLFDVAAIERDGARDVVLSVVAMSGLPEEVIALGREEEVFYLASAKDQDLPEEGKGVRQYVSEDWLRQYYHAQEQYMRIVPASHLEQACASVVEAFLQEPWF